MRAIHFAVLGAAGLAVAAGGLVAEEVGEGEGLAVVQLLLLLFAGLASVVLAATAGAAAGAAPLVLGEPVTNPETIATAIRIGVAGVLDRVVRASPVRRDPDNDHFTGPFVMAAFNTRVVQRTASLLGYGELWVDAEEQEVELARLIVAPWQRGKLAHPSMAEPAESPGRAHLLAVEQRHGVVAREQEDLDPSAMRHLLLDGVAACLGGAEGVTHATILSRGASGPRSARPSRLESVHTCSSSLLPSRKIARHGTPPRP